jgi:hypothetical protein
MLAFGAIPLLQHAKEPGDVFDDFAGILARQAAR